MFDARLMELWKHGGNSARPLERAELEALFRPLAARHFTAQSVLLATHLGMLVLGAGLAAANVALYRANPTMRSVELALLAVSAAGAWLTFQRLCELRRLERADGTLLETFERASAFHARRLLPWTLGASLTPWLLTLAVNTRVDAEDGRYVIHSPLEFAFVSCVMIALTFVLTRRSLLALEHEQRTLRVDLAAEELAASAALPALRRRQRLETVLAALLLGLAVALSLWLWWTHSGSGP